MSEEKKPEEPKKEEKSPFGEDIVPVMYILYNKKLNDFAVVGVPGFLDNRVDAYAALKMAEKNLDEFYSKKLKFRDSFMKSVSIARNKMAFRNFLSKKRF